MVRTAAWIALAIFGAFSAWVVWEVGYFAIWASLLTGPAAWQAGADLVLFGLLSMVWMVHDAKRTGRTVWPYLPLTVLAGSAAVLLYLALAPKEQPAFAAPRTA